MAGYIGPDSDNSPLLSSSWTPPSGWNDFNHNGPYQNYSAVIEGTWEEDVDDDPRTVQIRVENAASGEEAMHNESAIFEIVIWAQVEGSTPLTLTDPFSAT